MKFSCCSVLVFLILTFSCVTIRAQNTFINTYNVYPETGSRFKSFALMEGGEVLGVIGSVVEIPSTRGECSIAKINSFGDITWTARLGDDSLGYLLSFQHGTIINADTVLSAYHVIGREVYERNSGLLRINYEEETFQIEPISVADTLLYSRDLHYYNNFQSIADVRVRWNGPERSSLAATIVRRDRTGAILSSTPILDEYRRVGVRNSVVDEMGNVYVSYHGCEDDGSSSCNFLQGWLRKYSADDEVVWTRNYGSTGSEQSVAPQVALLADGDLAFAWTRDTFNPLVTQLSPPVIYFTSPEGVVHDSLAFHGSIRSAIALTAAANGDVIGVGTVLTYLGSAGWMFRATAHGELVWQRYILDERNTTRAVCDLTNVQEGSDGSIYAAGAWFSPPPTLDGTHQLKSWLVKLDADGCLEPGCTSDTIHLQEPVSVDQPPGNALMPSLQIAPNPVTTTMNFSVEGLTGNTEALRYKIYAPTGAVLQEGAVRNHEQRVETESWLPGLYILSVHQNGRPVATSRFVKQ